jgi:hypothetical protein
MWSARNSSTHDSYYCPSKVPIPKRTPTTAPEHATPIPVIEKKGCRLWSDDSAPFWREACDGTSQHKQLPSTGIQVCFVNDDEEAKRLFDEYFCSGCDVDEDEPRLSVCLVSENEEAQRLYDEYVKGVIVEEEDRRIDEEVKRLIDEEEAQSPLGEEAKYLFG